MTANEQFNRIATVVVDTLQLTAGDVRQGLRCSFSVESSLKPEPNKARISIYNLNPDHRSQLEELEDVAVSLSAGYEGTGESIIFEGFLRKASSTKNGPDWVTTVQSGDGQDKYQSRRVNLTFPAGTPVTQVIQRVAKALGYTYAPTGPDAFESGGSSLRTGIVINGSAAREIGKLLKACGKEWSIQGGTLQVLNREKALQETAISLSKDTGLVGTPTVDNKGVMKCVALMQPDVRPGRQIVIEALQASGSYRIEFVRHIGDTHAAPWYVEIEGKRL